MKFILTLSIYLLSLSAQSFEIHCQTDQQDIDLVLKKSEESGLSYALLFTPDDLLEHYVLKNESIVDTSLESFTYRDSSEDGEEELILLSHLKIVLKHFKA